MNLAYEPWRGGPAFQNEIMSMTWIFPVEKYRPQNNWKLRVAEKLEPEQTIFA